MKILLFNKPFQVLCQFSPHEQKTTLKDFIDTPNHYPCGRLDYDSEGLLILSDNGLVQALIADPKHKLPKTYWVQVEGTMTPTALDQLRQGVTLKDGITKPAKADLIDEPNKLWQRTPPIRERKNIPTSWISLTIKEGKNRQVRRMTAAVGYPTLRLVRASIGTFDVMPLAPGEWRYTTLPDDMQAQVEAMSQRKAQRQTPRKAQPKMTQRKKPHTKPSAKQRSASTRSRRARRT